MGASGSPSTDTTSLWTLELDHRESVKSLEAATREEKDMVEARDVAADGKPGPPASGFSTLVLRTPLAPQTQSAVSQSPRRQSASLTAVVAWAARPRGLLGQPRYEAMGRKWYCTRMSTQSAARLDGRHLFLHLLHAPQPSFTHGIKKHLRRSPPYLLLVCAGAAPLQRRWMRTTLWACGT